MKKILLVINLFLFVGISSIVMVGCNEASSSKSEKETTGSSESLNDKETFPVAYINTDSLLRQYKLAIELQEELLKKEEKSRTDFNEKAKKLQTEMTEFQRKVQNNGFLSRQRAEQEQRNLVEKDKELQQLNSKLSNELMVEQENLNRQLKDTLSSYLEEFNADGRYKLILSNTLGANVLYSAPGINITQIVADELNARFDKSREAKK